MTVETALIFGIVAAMATGALLLPAKRWAVQLGAVDEPSDRGFQVRSIPRTGGLAIVPLILLGVWLYRIATGEGDWIKLGAYSLAACLVAAVSLRDDIREVKIGIRLVMHAVAAIIILGCGYWQDYWLPGTGLVDFGMFGSVITFLWLFGFTNAFNFMDGIDGIAGVQAAIAGLGWSLVLISKGATTAAMLAVLLTGASIGFLFHNWPPAKLFLGDLGSAFLGFSFASLGLLADSGDSRMPVLAGFMVLPFVLDSFLTFLVRLFRRKRVWEPHRRHLYQRLALSGFGHSRVTAIYGVFAAASVVTILLWHRQILESGSLIFGGASLVTAVFWFWVERREKHRRH